MAITKRRESVWVRESGLYYTVMKISWRTNPNRIIEFVWCKNDGELEKFRRLQNMMQARLATTILCI